MRKPTAARLRKLLKDQKDLQNIPPKGKDFIAYKKVLYCRSENDNARYQAVLMFYVAKNASRRNGLSRTDKFRVSGIFVLKAFDVKTKREIKAKRHYHSNHDWDFKYRLEEWHKPRLKFARASVQCASGIHGFLCKQEAMNYRM